MNDASIESPEPAALAQLRAELARLRIEAGAPSYARLAQIVKQKTGEQIAKTTLFGIFQFPGRLPRLEYLRNVVEALGGNVDYYEGLWRAAAFAYESRGDDRPALHHLQPAAEQDSGWVRRRTPANFEIYLGWAGNSSRLFAKILASWLPEVVQQIKPSIPEVDSASGRRWSSRMSDNLERSSYGILCITRGNLRDPWLHFEAGVLARNLPPTAVLPILFGLGPAEVTGPLAQFQLTQSRDYSEMLRLVSLLNEASPAPIEGGRLTRAFERTWNDYKAAIDDIDVAEVPDSPSSRGAEEIMQELLVRVREMQRQLTTVGDSQSTTSVNELPIRDRNGHAIEVGDLVEGPDLPVGRVAAIHRTFGGAILVVELEDADRRIIVNDPSRLSRIPL